MRNTKFLISSRFGLPGFVLFFVFLAVPNAIGFVEDDKVYVCQPCGLDCDKIEYKEKGACPTRGMPLVDKDGPENRPMAHNRAERKKVAILLFDGVQIIDFTGPYEVFGQAGFEVMTVAEKKDAITTSMGMSVNPAYDLENCPEVEVVVVPGGNVLATQNSEPVQKWLQHREKGAETVLSVCNGAYILAASGLLKGLRATTFYNLIEGLALMAPDTEVVSDQRFVDNGKIVTTAGLSSGIDGSLHVVAKHYGKARAQQVALNLEYDWRPDEGFARAALADRHLRQIFGNGLRLELEGARLADTRGDRTNWKARWRIESELNPPAILDQINRTLEERGEWTKVARRDASPNQSTWRFKDGENRPWRAAVEVSNEGEHFLLSITLNQAD